MFLVWDSEGISEKKDTIIEDLFEACDCDSDDESREKNKSKKRKKKRSLRVQKRSQIVMMRLDNLCAWF